jgi:hypothetical protein
MMAIITKKVFASAIISAAIILFFYGIAKFSGTEHPMFVFYLSITIISLLLAVTCLGLLIGKIFGVFSATYCIFVGTFGLVNSLMLLIIKNATGLSNLYYIILCANALVFFTMGLAVCYFLKTTVK